MAAVVDEFSLWLGNKLQALNTDENVFGTYITGILDGDESVEEKTEAIQELLAEIIEADISVICKEIIDMWNKSHPKVSGSAANAIEEVDSNKLVQLLELQCLATTAQRNYTAEEKKIREAILAKYSQMTDDEDEQNDQECCSTSTAVSVEPRKAGADLERNTNALSVQQAEKEKREQAKINSQKKKDKDKEDREKQLQMKEEKKEKRKTQKGERRR